MIHDFCPFEILKIDLAYSIDMSLIDSQAKLMLEKIHPDRFLKDTAEWDMANEVVQRINHSVCVLKDPVKRASILLEKCTDQSAQSHPKSQSLMIEVMEMNEALAELDEESKLKDFVNLLSVNIEECSQNFHDAILFKKRDKISEYYQALSFYYKIKNDALCKMCLHVKTRNESNV